MGGLEGCDAGIQEERASREAIAPDLDRKGTATQKGKKAVVTGRKVEPKKSVIGSCFCVIGINAERRNRDRTGR